MREIALHILDLIENSLRAQASAIAVTVEAVPAQDLLRIVVEDNGSGLKVPPETVLDPFYTTKQLGRGLGLPATLGIIKAHQAALQVESRAGAGSTFRLWFPVAGSSRPTTKASPTKA